MHPTSPDRHSCPPDVAGRCVVAMPCRIPPDRQQPAVVAGLPGRPDTPCAGSDHASRHRDHPDGIPRPVLGRARRDFVWDVSRSAGSRVAHLVRSRPRRAPSRTVRRTPLEVPRTRPRSRLWTRPECHETSAVTRDKRSLLTRWSCRCRYFRRAHSRQVPARNGGLRSSGNRSTPASSVPPAYTGVVAAAFTDGPASGDIGTRPRRHHATIPA